MISAIIIDDEPGNVDVLKKMDTQNILVLFVGDTKNKSYCPLERMETTV